jgi:CRP-like cAMP-binding protein
MAPKKRASMLQQGQQNFNFVTPQPGQNGAMDVILEGVAIDVFEDDIDNEPDSPSNPHNSTLSKKAKKKVGKKGKSKNKKIGAPSASPTPQSLGTIPGPALGSESRGSLLQPSGGMTTPIPKTRLSLLATSTKFDSGASSSATKKRASQLVTSQSPTKKRGSQLITSAKRGSTLVKTWKQRSGSLLVGKQRSGSLLVKSSGRDINSAAADRVNSDDANSDNAAAAPGSEAKRTESVAKLSASTDDLADKPVGGKKKSTLGKKLSKMSTMGDLDGKKLSKLGKPQLMRGTSQPMPDIQTVEEMENLEGEEKISALQKWKSKAKHLIKVRKSKSRLFAEASKTIQPLAESDAKEDRFSVELSEPVEGKKRHDSGRASDARHSLFARRKSASARDLGEHRESNLAFSINLPGAARRGSRLSINLRRGSLMSSDARRKSWFDPKNLGFISEKSDQPAAESSESESESSNSEEWSGSSLSDDSSSSEEELDGEEKDEKTKANHEYWKTAKTLLKHTTSDERTDEDVAFILTALRMRFDFFKNLAIDIAKKACIYAEYQKFDEGDELMEQGEDPEALYVIVSGEIGIYSQSILGEGCDNERQLRAVQRAGNVIGEWGLVRGESATATCVANTRRVATISISAEAYQEHIAAHRADKVKGMAVSMILRTVKPFERSKQDIKVVVDYMATRPIFTNVERDKLEDIGQQIDWLSITNVQPGQPHVIWKEGEKADSILFIFKGSVSLYRTSKTKGDESTVLVSTLKEGGIVGELSVAMGLDRFVKVVADSPCDFLVIPRAPYMRHMAAHRSDVVLFEAALTVLRCEQEQQNRHRSQIDMHILEKLMEGLSVFHALDSITRRLIVQKVDYRLAPKGTVLCKEGDNADACYIILAGKVSIHRYPQSKEARLRKAVSDLQKSIDELKVDEAWIDWQDRCPIRHYWSQRRRAVLDMFLTFEASTCDQRINHWLAGQRKQVEDFAQVKVLHEVARTSARRAISEPAFTAWHSAEVLFLLYEKNYHFYVRQFYVFDFVFCSM